MNLRLNSILLFITALLFGWYFLIYNSEDNGLNDLIKDSSMPEYVGDKMTTAVFDINGLPQYAAEADEIKYYENSEKTEFFNPLVNLFDKTTALKQWQLSAKNAEITKDKILYLVGDVKLQALDPTAQLQRIETERLRVDLESQDIDTDVMVKSTGLGFNTTGIGLKGNLKHQTATLLKDVKSYIEPTIIKQTENTK